MKIRFSDPRLLVIVSLVAWAILYARGYLHVGALERISPWAPAALALIAFAGLLRRSVPRAIRGPLLFACLLTAGAGVALLGVGGDSSAVREAWQKREERDIGIVLDAVRERIENLLGLSASIGESAGAFLRDNVRAAGRDPVGVRLDAFHAIDELSTEIARSAVLPSDTELGIQVFDASGTRWAWAGWPQTMDARDRSFLASGKELVYSRQVSLYRMLTHIMPVFGDGGPVDSPGASDRRGEWLGSVVIDIPLEVNYRVNNKFLKSAGLADDIARRSAARIRFDYLPVDPRLPDLLTNERGRVTLDRSGEVTGNETSGLGGRGVVRLSPGNELFNVSVEGRPLQHFVQSRNNRAYFAANLAILAAMLVFLGLSLLHFPAGLAGPGGVVKVVYLVAAFAVVRYSLVWFQPDFLSTRWRVFEPAVFATPILGGLMRSAGDLLITSLFLVAAVYGALRIGRAVDGNGEANRPRHGGPPLSLRGLVVLKGLLAAALSLGAFFLAKEFIATTVTNANPRLVGETVKVLEPEVAVLHLSSFLMVAGIFLAGMICIWGVYRSGRRSDVLGTSAVAAGAVLVLSLALLRFDLLVIPLLALLFAALAPRLVRREDLVSIVIGAFFFVIIVSAAAYVFFNGEYQNLRRTFIREKVAEVTHPADNWKVFILEDILENFSEDNALRQTLADARSSSVQRLAFDLWAGSPLSLLGYSCAIHVFDEADSLLSRFAVEMPFRLRLDEPGERLETPSSQQWAVLDLTTDTPQGAVRFYRGIVNLERTAATPYGAARLPAGKVVVDVPFFFESLAWAARTGPQTPEVLRNVQEGGIAPRLEETEPIVLARVRGTRVLQSSRDPLPVGYTFEPAAFERAIDLEWPLLKTGGATYRFFAEPTGEPGISLVAGFPVPTPVQHLLRWSMVLSLYFFFAVGLIVFIIVLKNLPLVGRVMPTLTPGRQLGFQQKLLGSFLLVALLPAVMLGVFSVRMIKERFVQESRNEALYRAYGASKSLNNLLVDGLRALMPRGEIGALLEGEQPSGWWADDKRRVGVFVVPSDMPLDDGSIEELSGVLDRMRPEQAFLHYVEGKPYVGVISEPVSVLTSGTRENVVVYHGRLADGDLLGEISDQAGADVNLFNDGQLVATSREGLLSGGFISSSMNADAFVKVSVMGVDYALSTEKAGRYNYEVAYVPVPGVGASGDVLGTSGNAALGVPLLFRPESYTVEVDKARSLVLSIFALLSAATIGLGLFLARGIFRPLRGLIEGTRRIARGDFSFELPGRRGDEIGTVMEAFNEMTRQVSRSQTVLEERRKYLEIILENIGTGVISTDAEDRVSAVNTAAERILGMRGGDLVGKKVDELARGALRDFFLRIADRTLPEADDGGSSEVEIVQDGQKRTIKYMRTPLTTDGRRLGAVLVFEDLTELINSKKLSAWVEMARQIAHEIKNPLTPIKLSTQFMVRAHEERSANFDRIFRESSETIMQQVDVLRNIASEFSSFGRLQQLYLAPHDVVGLVGEIVTPYQRNAGGVTVVVDAPPGELRAMVDPEAVRKICRNLVENAMEAMAGGGQLHVSFGEARIDGRRLVTVSFRDTGPGLSDEVKARLFQPYFSTKTTGTGLGLAICRSLSREMGGEVTVENLPGGPGVEAVLYVKAV